MSDKLNKNINESMLEGLLSDEDKPKPPKPTYPTYSGGRGSQGNFDWSRGDDFDGFKGNRGRYAYEEEDEDENNFYGRHRPYVPPRSTAPVSTGATSYSGGMDISAATINAIKTALANGMHSGMKHYFMAEVDANLLANAVVRAIGEVFDKVGLSWGASGSKAAKALVYDMLASNVFYNTPTRGYKELDFGGELRADNHDPATGEVEDDDIERKAIMEVDGGIVTEGDNE